MSSSAALCDECGRPGELKRCVRCESQKYCSRECQRRAWPRHKQECDRLAKRLDASAAPSSSSGGQVAAGKALLVGSDAFHLLGRQEGTSQDGQHYPFGQASDVVSIAFGASHALACSSSGALYTWGLNEEGAIAQPEQVEALTSPKAVSALESKVITEVACGATHSLAIDREGRVYAWGLGEHGQLGINKDSRRMVAIAADEKRWDLSSKTRPKLMRQIASHNVVRVSCGDNHSVMLTDGGLLFSCGDNAHGQCGFEGTANPAIPTLVEYAAADPIVDVSCGSIHTLAVDVSGTLIAFGSNKRGACGVGKPEDVGHLFHPTCVDVAGTVTFVAVAAGGQSSMAVTQDGALFAWGQNHRGQLGIPERKEDLYVLHHVQHVYDVRSASISASHAVVVTHEGQLRVFGAVTGPSLDDYEGVLCASAGTDISGVIVGGSSDAARSSGGASRRHRPRPPAAFSYRRLRYLRRRAKLDRDFKPLALWVKRVLSEPSTLNASFYPPNAHDGGDEKKDEGASTRAVDIILVEQFYAALLKVSDEALRGGIDLVQVIISSQQACMKRMAELMRRRGLFLSTPAALRCFLIILVNPVLSKPTDEHAQLLRDVTALILKLPGSMIQAFVAMLAFCLPSDLFERTVKTIKRNIEAGLTRGGGAAQQAVSELPDDVTLLIELISLFHTANGKRPPKPHESDARSTVGGHASSYAFFRVPPTTFYLTDAVMDRVDLARDLFVWKDQLQVPHVVLAQRPAFTFCAHAYVLGPLTKAYICRIETLVGTYRRQVTSGWPVCEIDVRRSMFDIDAFEAIRRFEPSALKKKLVIRFAGEEAIDEGGPTREFFQKLVKHAIKEEVGVFVYRQDSRFFWFSEDKVSRENAYVCGKAFALALYHGITLGASQFPLPFFKLLLTGPDHDWSVSDLFDFQPDVAKGLVSLLEYDGSVEDVFGLDFTITVGADHRQVELVGGGSNVAVTNENRESYVRLYVKHVFVGAVRGVLDGFLRGWSSIWSGDEIFWKTFQPEELAEILCGNPEMDFKSLESKTVYQGYTAESNVIRWFWDVVHSELTETQRKNLLTFATGASRPPVGGLGNLRFIIQRQGPDSEQLPTAHTCFNVFLLPEYASREKLKQKLLVALAHHEGFGLQ